MSEYNGIFNDWKDGVTSTLVLNDIRGISRKTQRDVRLVINENEAIFPYGRNRQVPDRFKIINVETKSQFFSQHSSLVTDIEEYKAPFFNQQDFTDKSYVIVTEGEWDCLSWIEKGYTNVVSLPNGITAAPSVFEREFLYLNQFDEIYINFDADKHGKQMIKKIQQMIPKHKFRWIFFPDDIKDANKALTSGYDLKEFFDSAHRVKMKSVVSAGDISIDEVFNATPEGITCGFYDLDKMLGGLRPGEVTVVTGDTASGKTTFACHVAYNVAERTRQGIWIASQEMRAAKILEKIGSVALKIPIRDGNVEQYHKEQLGKIFKNYKIYIDPQGHMMTMDSVMESLTYAYYAYGVKVAVVEDLGFLSTSMKDGEERERIERIIQQLHSKALETGLHILLIVHPTQSRDDRGFMSMANMKGSSGIKQYADNVLVVQRMDRAFPQYHNVHKFSTVTVCKNRAMGSEGKVVLEYHKEYDGFSTSVVTPQQIQEWCR